MLDFNSIDAVVNDVTPDAVIENIVFNAETVLKTKSGNSVHLMSKSGNGANHSFNIISPTNIDNNHPLLNIAVGEKTKSGNVGVDEDDWCANLASELNWFVNEDGLKSLVDKLRSMIGEEKKISFSVSGRNFWIVSDILIILVVKEAPNLPGTLTIH